MPSPQLTAARKHLTDAQLIAFLRAAAKEDHPRAPGSFCKRLDLGWSLDRIFDPPPPPDGRAMMTQAVLKVKVAGERTYLITAGYKGEVGDGGDWQVAYGTDGELLSCEPRGWWMH